MERLAAQVGAAEVTALHVEAGIAEARAQMHSVLGATADGGAEGEVVGCPVHRPAAAAPADDAAGRCPVPHSPLREAAEPVMHPGVVAAPRGLNEYTAGFVESLGNRGNAGPPRRATRRADR